MWEASEEAIQILTTDYPPNSLQIVAFPTRIFETVEVGITNALRWLYSRIDKERTVECKPCH